MKILTIHGERYVTVDWVAQCYSVEERWVLRALELGYVGPAETVEGAVALPAASLERLARIRRLELQLGFELEALEPWVDRAE